LFIHERACYLRAEEEDFAKVYLIRPLLEEKT